MVSFSRESERIVDEFWASETSCRPRDFDSDTVAVAVRPSTDGSDYVHLFRRRQRVQITCSHAVERSVRSLVDGRTAADVFDATLFVDGVGGRVTNIVGPAYIGYLDSIEDSAGPAELLAGPTGPLLEGLRAAVSEQEWEYSGLDEHQPIAAVVVRDVLVSAAGYEVWPGRIAHIGVVTAAGQRGLGYAQSCVKRIARYAVEEGLFAQYRTLYTNIGAMAIARSVGFVDYAATIYVALPGP